MNSRIQKPMYNSRQMLHGAARLAQFVLVLAILLGPLASITTLPVLAASRIDKVAAPLAQASASITLNVISARTEPRTGISKGDAITSFKYIINIDNTGSTEQRQLVDGCTPEDPAYPSSCKWTSIAGAASSSPIYTQGDQTDFANGVAFELPPGRYLISVLADGFKLDGAHFTVPASGNVPVTVELQPYPLPTATIRAQVFEDISPTNGAPDLPAEHGLAGFEGHIADYIGEVTTDIYGNPLCTDYETDVNGNIILDADFVPTPLPGTGGKCVSDANGVLTIPNLGPNRYALSVVPPDGQSWTQTTTLEGNHDWDSWVMEGATGLDTEFVIAGEPFPVAIFGYVAATDTLPATAQGSITGIIAATKVYIPAKGGQALPGTIWGGLAGAKLDKPIDKPWIALADLANGDTAVWIGQGNADGSFTIPHVPDGNYTLTYWDEPQDYILDLINITVSGGEAVDMGILPLTGWWTTLEGYVYNDLNENGKRDPGEPGIANYLVAMKKRENSLMDRGAIAVTTDNNGYYFMENVYPMTQWLVVEAYNDLYYTTGVTYQADNQTEETTVLGAGVDVSILPIIGLGGRLDWGVHQYDPATNGGIAGTVSYDTTRNEFDPRLAAVEDWQPGIPDLDVNLYLPVRCNTNPGTPCDASGRYELAPDGSFAIGNLINTYLTETWERPTGCVARDVDGVALNYPADQQVLPLDPNAECLEGPLAGVQFQTGFSAVDGNYGFGDGCFGVGGFDANTGGCADGSEPTPLAPGDYLVRVAIPNDPLGRPLYQVTKEEDINIYNGDQFEPQIPPPECAGPMHIVDVAGVDAAGNIVGADTATPVVNPSFYDNGGTPYEGQLRPLCDTKLIRVSNGRSIAPTFNLFTDVPIPGRFWGLIVDDLTFSSDPKSLLYGEKAGVAFAPVGIYDYTNRLVTTVESDYNGLWDVLLPSTNRISCPTPSGVCANLYRLVGNDPGIPGHLNPNYNPQFRTIAAEFESLPGLIVPADLAPTQVGVTIQLPGSQFNAPVLCALESTTPQIFAVSRPYADITAGAATFTITGQGFGAIQGSGQVTLDGGTVLPVTAWNDRQIDVSVPATTTPGARQLAIKAGNGQRTVNGLTFHVLSSGSSNPFPSNSVLDNFNRGNGALNGGLVSTNPWGGLAAYGLIQSLRIQSNQVQVRNGGGFAYWNSPSGVYGADQEAYFTFRSPLSTNAQRQDLLLKMSAPSLLSQGPSYIDVRYNVQAQTVTIVTQASGPNQNAVVRATITGVIFGAGDVFGARTLADGTVAVYKNGVLLGVTNVTSGANPWPGAAGGGRIGVSFALPNGAQAYFDDFGGGSIAATPTAAPYNPDLYEVGPGRQFATIQSALDAAAADATPDNNALVVVYPGQPDLSNPRANPRGAYYENLIMVSPVKLQGVGPGGFNSDGIYVPGSIIDGGAFGGDTALADAWRTKLAGLTWLGNQNTYEGQTIYVLAQTETQYGAGYKAAIDGFDLRGGDQQGFPNNINQIGGEPTGLPANVVSQGGAIFVNAYVRNLQITNNVVQNNGGSYGTIRIGTPDLPAPETSQHNENLRIANNRIIANGGTNLAGGIGIYAGADGYDVLGNDICGNFSAEYGGGLTVYGFSPGGKIHDNRIYFNRSYDEGGGIMIAGELPANPATLSPGSGAVDIYNNQIQANLSNDDGGGIRFLMAGNYPIRVYNNLIVNNVSTHEGGGVSLNDAPAVQVYNNTIMKNVTTATALTSNGFPAPAGLATSLNSDLLQATLPLGSPIFSDPVLFNNIFWDNRAGTRGGGTVTGIGIAGDASPINYWDLGVSDGSGLVSPTTSIVQVSNGAVPSGSNLSLDPGVIASFDVSVAFTPWRTNPNFVGAILVATDLAPNLMGNYHIAATSPAIDAAAAGKTVGSLGVSAPLFDFDHEARPGGVGYDIGADEIAGSAPEVFPATAVLDNFNRGDGGVGGSWSGDLGVGSFLIQGQQVLVRNGGAIGWNAAFDANQEAYLTFTQVGASASQQGIFLKLNGSSPTANNASLIRVIYDAPNSAVRVQTRTRQQGWVNRATINSTIGAGDKLGGRALADGTVTVFKNGAQIGSVNVTSGANPWPAAFAQGGGRIGAWFAGTSASQPAQFDDFGGGAAPTQVIGGAIYLPAADLPTQPEWLLQTNTMFMPVAANNTVWTGGQPAPDDVQAAPPIYLPMIAHP